MSLLWLTAFALALLVLALRWAAMPLRAAAARRRASAGDQADRDAWFARGVSGRCYLSLIIPAYNERDRLPEMLRAAAKYLLTRRAADAKFTFEVLVVDDGSSDGTSAVAAALGAALFGNNSTATSFRVAALRSNRGKGGAVREGALRSRGDWVLVVDADGATSIADVERLEREARAAPGDDEGRCLEPVVVCGSRAHLVATDAVATRSPLRNALMVAFHLAVGVVGGVRGVRDTQCGFKLLSRAAAKTALGALNIERWAFDVELLFLALRLGFEVGEVAVTWHEVDGSKLSIATDSLQMARDIACVRFAYTAGLWQLPERPAAAP